MICDPVKDNIALALIMTPLRLLLWGVVIGILVFSYIELRKMWDKRCD